MMKKIGEPPVYRLAEHVKFTVIDGTAVVMDMRAAKYLGLSEVATRILELLATHRPVAEVVETLTQEYEVPDDVLRADVERTIGDFTQRGLIEPLRPSQS